MKELRPSKLKSALDVMKRRKPPTWPQTAEAVVKLLTVVVQLVLIVWRR